jgi:hypothetical protein
MSRIDPECFPQASFSAERVCTSCINDEDLNWTQSVGPPDRRS